MERQSGLVLSPEAIYAAIYALPRGELRREIIGCLRHARPLRAPKPTGSERRGKLVGAANIKERPNKLDGRPVPGYWEGDLILGANGSSSIGRLVERTTRFVVLVRMPARRADVAASAFADALHAIPESRRKTLAYDQGEETSGHAGLAETAGLRIYFADPRSPSQRGANAWITGLLRQCCPKGDHLSGFDQADLDRVADGPHARPRKTLDFATPGEKLRGRLAGLVGARRPLPGGVRPGTRLRRHRNLPEGGSVESDY